MNFTTLFDKNYLARGLVLIKSLQDLNETFQIYVIALDNVTSAFFNNNKIAFPQVKVVSLESIEDYFPELKIAIKNRTLIEFYFTLSPYIPLFLLKTQSISHICSLDADMKFYSSPKAIFDHLDDYSIIITPHKFSKENTHLDIYGKNNVSFQLFKNDKAGLICLQKWKENCFEYCFDKLDESNQKYADQKYLDEWENKYEANIKILNNDITGLAVWNINNYTIQIKNGSYYSNNNKIIFYHFHNFKLQSSNICSNGFNSYHVQYQKGLTKLYYDYWKSITYFNSQLKTKSDNSLRSNNSSCSLFDTLKHEKSLYLFTLWGGNFVINKTPMWLSIVNSIDKINSKVNSIKNFFRY